MEITLDGKNYAKIILVLNHICRIQQAILEIKGTYFPRVLLTGDFVDVLEDKYINNLLNDITSKENMESESDDMGLTKVMNEILINQNQILLNTINSLPEDYVNSKTPNANKIFELRSELDITYKKMAEILSDNAVEVINQVTDKLQ